MALRIYFNPFRAGYLCRWQTIHAMTRREQTLVNWGHVHRRHQKSTGYTKYFECGALGVSCHVRLLARALNPIWFHMRRQITVSIVTAESHHRTAESYLWKDSDSRDGQGSTIGNVTRTVAAVTSKQCLATINQATKVVFAFTLSEFLSALRSNKTHVIHRGLLPYSQYNHFCERSKTWISSQWLGNEVGEVRGITSERSRPFGPAHGRLISYLNSKTEI